MKEKIKNIIWGKESEKTQELETKWWHRLFKVLIYAITIVFFFYGFNFYFEESAVSAILNSLLYVLVVYFFLNIIYYRIILYIVYGESEYTKIWSIRKIGIFILIIIFFFCFAFFNCIFEERRSENILQNESFSHGRLLREELLKEYSKNPHQRCLDKLIGF